MKSKLLIVLTILVASTAQAEHHRGHAVTRLEASIENLDKTLNNFASFDANARCPVIDLPEVPLPADVIEDARTNCDIAMATIDTAHGHLVAAAITLNEQLAAIEIDGTDILDVTRHDLNQPHDIMPDGTRSVSRLLEAAGEAFTGQVMRRGVTFEDGHNRYTAVLHYIWVSWGFAQRAEWHTVDAIREERYADTEFGCCHGGEHNDADPEGMGEVEPELDSNPTLDNGR